MINIINLKGVIDLVQTREITALLWVIVIDVFLGITRAVMKKELKSNIGLIGLIKHTIVIVLIIAMGIFAPIFELDAIFKGLVLFYIIQYLLSIIENLILLKIPIPKFIVDRIKELESENEKYEGGKKI